MIILNTKYPKLIHVAKAGVSFDTDLTPGAHLELECMPDEMARERGLHERILPNEQKEAMQTLP